MELLVATWALRISVVAAFAVGAASYSVGTPVIECVDRALAAAVAFTIAGRVLIGWLEPPEKRLLRMRRQRERRRSKQLAKNAGARAADRRGSGSTVSRTA